MRKDNGSASPRVVPLKPSANTTDDDDEMLVEDQKALLPEGWYQAIYTGHDSILLFGRAAKIFLNFTIVDEASKYNGVRLIRPYRVSRLAGRPGPNGKFVLSAGGDLYRTLVRLLDTRARPDRISLRPLKELLFRVRAGTVDRDRDGRELPEAARYSVIRDIEDGR